MDFFLLKFTVGVHIKLKIHYFSQQYEIVGTIWYCTPVHVNICEFNCLDGIREVE